MKSIRIKSILNFLDKGNTYYEFLGNEEDEILGFSSITNYKENTITWIKNEEKLIEVINDMRDTIIRFLVIPHINIENMNIKNCIKVTNPKKVFFDILENFYGEVRDSSIGHNNVISPLAKIGQNVYIGNNCVIEDNVEIGEGTKLYNNVTIAKNVKIGKNCTVKSGAVIGEIGFGYSVNENGESIRVPHFGSVVIGDNVDIGANTTIERGTIDDTIIENGVKIDDLCQISHNVHIGENTVIITNTSIYGSVSIGKNCYISTSVIRNQLRIGDNVTIGMGSVVVKDIEAGSLVYGNPAKKRT